MRSFRRVVPNACSNPCALTSSTARRMAASYAEGEAAGAGAAAGEAGAGAGASGSAGSSLGAPDTGKKRNIIVMANTTKAIYIHPQNHIASWYWFRTDYHRWLVFGLLTFVGSQVLARWRIAKSQTTAQAQLGENLLDQRTRDLLGDIESLRAKDPLRLENEANLFHEQFWKRRAKVMTQERNERRSAELTRGMLQGEARGTDMTEWLGAKAKDEQEREVARRTHDYIQGFHQHLKAKRLI